MKFKYSVGYRFGKNSSLEIIGIESSTKENNKRNVYVVKCHECCKDPALNGDAIYKVTTDYIRDGKLPCGCSKSEKKSKHQWEVLLNRKAKENNHVFNGFVGDLKGQNTKIDITCNNCGVNYKTCSIHNYLRDRGCPSCADIAHTARRTLPENVWIQKFIESGQFDEDQYIFKRLSVGGRKWSVYCKKCNTETISDNANLVAGKVPCNCNSGGGFDVNKPSYFYILEFSIYGEKLIKYGITNFYKRRLVDHKRSLRDLCGVIENFRVFSGDSKSILAMESEFKRNFVRNSKQANGFKKECCSDSYMEEILGGISNLELEEIQQTY